MRGRDNKARLIAEEALARASNAGAVASGSAFSAQTAWFIDPVNGSDTQSGSSPETSLKTISQLVQRRGSRFVIAANQSVDITLLNPLPTTDPVSIQVEVTDPSAHFGLHGTLVSLLAGTIASFSPSVPSTNTFATVTFSAGLTAAHVGKLVFFSNLNAWSVIVSVTGQVATLTDPTVLTNNNLTAMKVTPAPGEVFVIYTGTVCNLSIETVVAYTPSGGIAVKPSTQLVIENLAPVGWSNIRCHGGNPGGGPTIQQCCFQECNVSGDGIALVRHCGFHSVDNGPRGFAITPSATNGITIQSSAFISDSRQANYFANCAFGTTSTDTIIFWGNNQALFTLNRSSYNATIGWNIPTGGELNINGQHIPSAPWFGTAADATFLHIQSDTAIDYVSGFVIYATGSSTQFLFADTSGLAQPSLNSVAGGNIPALADCRTWSQLTSPPFNGAAFEYAHGCRFAPLGT